MNPVPSYGGNVCCTGNAVTGGAFDQRKMEARADILVYTTRAVERRHRRSAARSTRRSMSRPTPRIPISR